MRSNKIFLVVMIVIFGSVLFLLVRFASKNHEIYKQSEEMVKTNKNVIALLGEPIKTSFFFSGGSRNMNYARYNIFFKGPKGKGYVSTKAHKKQGGWRFAYAIFKSQDKEINLLADNRAVPQFNIVSTQKDSHLHSNIIFYILMIFIFIVIILLLLQYIVRFHEVYKRSIKMIETNEDIIALLGKPIKTCFFLTFDIHNMNYAKYNIRFKGLNYKGSLSVIANKKQGEWLFDKAVFRSQSQVIDLLAENTTLNSYGEI